MEQKTKKKVLVFKIIAFEYGTASSRNPGQDTSNRLPMC